MMSKVCIITGATDGIGKQTAFELAKKGFAIGLVGRNQEKGNDVLKEILDTTHNESVHFFRADLSLMKELPLLAEKIKHQYDSIDVLINNAGAYFSEYIETSEGFESTFALNHLNYFYLTNLLIGMVKDGNPGRIINVASLAHRGAKLDLNDIQMSNNYSGWTAYSNSKLMNILYTYEIHRRFKDTGITFNCLHPGFVDSNFGENNSGFARKFLNVLKSLFAINVVKGARTSVYLATSDYINGVSGKFFIKCKDVSSSKVSYLGENQSQLWKLSEDALQKVRD
jgi:NAD(P)-dependent dehydrogenase (short-subunit alcohol dehydrogenase family)